MSEEISKFRLKKHPVQPGQEIYTNRKNENILLWLSYWATIEAILGLDPSNILEIGIGRGIVSNYLKHVGFPVHTCDHNIDLKPNYAADVTELPFPDNTFECIICCEVLEHMPFSDSIIGLKEIQRVTSKYAVISVPFQCASFSFMFRFFPVAWIEPFFKFIGHGVFGPFGRSLTIPYFLSKTPFCENHYWEMGLKNYSKRTIRNTIQQQNFKIIAEKENKMYAYQYFFILQKI